jgi:hypothetical protein
MNLYDERRRSGLLSVQLAAVEMMKKLEATAKKLKHTSGRVIAIYVQRFLDTARILALMARLAERRMIGG